MSEDPAVAVLGTAYFLRRAFRQTSCHAIMATRISGFLEHCCLPTSPLYGEDVLDATSTRTGILQVAVAIGIGFGSLAAGYCSSDKIEYGLIPLGSVGMTVRGFCDHSAIGSRSRAWHFAPDRPVPTMSSTNAGFKT